MWNELWSQASPETKFWARTHAAAAQLIGLFAPSEYCGCGMNYAQRSWGKGPPNVRPRQNATSRSVRFLSHFLERVAFCGGLVCDHRGAVALDGRYDSLGSDREGLAL